jgi:ABC-type dipeptide/oligopeptide/nickel transport system permease subunit
VTAAGRLRALRTGTGAVGLGLLVLVVGIALFGPFFAPHSPTEPVGIPFERPSGEALLGYDQLGRDVLSRVLWGGRSVLALAGLATLIAYAAGAWSGCSPATSAGGPTRCSCARSTC